MPPVDHVVKQEPLPRRERIKRWAYGVAVAGASFLAAWYAMVDSVLLHDVFMEPGLLPATPAVAAGVIIAGFLFRRVAAGRSQAATWIFGSYAASLSLFAVGEALWTLTGRMGLGYLLAAGVGGAAALAASGWPYYYRKLWGNDAKHELDAFVQEGRNPLVPILTVSAFFGVAVFWWSQGALFFEPSLLPQMIADWPFFAAAAVAIPFSLVGIRRLIFKFKIGESAVLNKIAGKRGISAMGIIGVVIGGIAAVIVASYPAAMALVPVWLVHAGVYAVFASVLPEVRESGVQAESVGTLAGFLLGWYAASSWVVQGAAIKIAPVLVTVFAALGFAVEKLILYWRRRRALATEFTRRWENDDG